MAVMMRMRSGGSAAGMLAVVVVMVMCCLGGGATGGGAELLGLPAHALQAGGAGGREYEELKPAHWTRLRLSVGETHFFSLHNSNPGNACTGACEQGNRWVRVAAHSQALPVKLTLSVRGEPLTPTGTCAANSTGCATTMSPSAALVSRLGTWHDQPEAACYVQGAEWVPFHGNPDMLIAVTLAPVSTATMSAADVAVFAELGSALKPMPGGCASTSSLLYDAMIDLQYSRVSTTIEYQQADFGGPLSANFPSRPTADSCTCDYVSAKADAKPGTLRYELYRTYLSNCGSDFHKIFDEDDLLTYLSHMTTVAEVKTYGVKVDNAEVLPDHLKMKTIDSVAGQGVIYNVLVTDVYRASLHSDKPIESFQSVYTPTHTYTCSLTDDPDQDNCHHLLNSVYMAVCMCAGLLGLFLAIFGLRFYVASMLIFAGLAVATSAYIIVENFLPELSYAAAIGISIGGGAVLVFPLLMCWRYSDWNGVWITFQGMVAGFLVACLVFGTPLGELNIFRNDFNYGLTFACVCMLLPVLLLVRPRLICIVSTSLVGCYLILYAVDFFVGSDFNDLFLNVIKRSSDSHFAMSYTGNYFTKDFNGCSNLDHNVAFLATWIAGTIIFCGVQHMLTGSKTQTVAGRNISLLPGRRNRRARSRNSSAGSEDETRPLLAHRRRPVFYQQRQGTVQNPPPPPPERRRVRARLPSSPPQPV